MPTTINGVGTHYYGKKNLSVRTGTCRSCGRLTNLESYDTRLWFVVVFIPVIPLGRKRIIDSCGACRRHFVTDQDQFAMARQLSLSGAQEKFRSDPTPEAAIAAHAEMLGFHAHEEAKAFRQEAVSQFPADAPLYASLASHLDEVGEFDAATELFQRAHQLDPTLPQARDGMAVRMIANGKLDEARSLVDFLERPGAGQLYPLGRLEQLADAFQKRGRHEEALALAEVLIREIPAVADHHQFRKFVKKSEAATRRTTSVLPQRKANWRALFNTRDTSYSPAQRWAIFLSIVAVLVVGGMAALNEYRRQHRTVYVYNPFGAGAQVSIDGNSAVPPGNRTEIVLGEGEHHVTISGAIEEEFDIDLATDYWRRWTYRPVWIINVGGAEQFLSEQLYYAENPRPSEGNLLAGDNLLFVPHVDYLFQPAPETLDVGSKGGQVIKQRLSVATVPPVNVFGYLLDNGSRPTGFRYAESRLLLDPTNNELLQEYVGAIADDDERNRVKQFLQSQLGTRPVLTGWHRTLQEMHTSAAEKAELLKQYDDLLKQEPDNGALLYLRGRLTPQRSVAREYFNRSIAADPSLSYPWMGLGYQALTVGDWEKCEEYSRRALELQGDENIHSTLLLAQLGLGKQAELEQEYRRQLETMSPKDAFPVMVRLATVLASKNDLVGAKQVIADWEAKVPEADSTLRDALDHFCGGLELATGNLADVEARISAGTALPALKLGWLLLSLRPDEAVNDPEIAPLLVDPWQALGVSLAYSLSGRSDEARLWSDRAAEALAKLDFDEVTAAAMLRSEQAPTAEEIDEVGIDPAGKSLLLAVLATRFPADRARLNEMARRLNVAPDVGGCLVWKAIEQTP